MLKKILIAVLCMVMLVPKIDVQAKETAYKVSTLDEADAAIYDALNQQATKMVLRLSNNMDYYKTYDLIVPYTRGLGSYTTHNFGYAVNGGTWDRLEINVRYYTSENEEKYLDLVLDNLIDNWSNGSTYDKIKSVHDKTANRVPGYNYHSAYDALVRHEAVCSGYALLFQKIMDRLDIPCYVYIDDQEIAHAWNIVNLDGSWYQIDCTWDDKENGFTYENFLKGSYLLGHNYTGTIELSKNDYKK